MTTAITPEAQAALAATSTADLLRKAYQLTHRIHAWEAQSFGERSVDLRAQRGLIDAEIIRREREAADLLRNARTKHTDPGLARSFGQRRRRLLDTLLAESDRT